MNLRNAQCNDKNKRIYMTFPFACFVVESACRISMNFDTAMFTKDVELQTFPSNDILAEETKICSPTCL
jgi:hypothetical protein